MCDNKNELHKSEYDKSKDNTSTRLDLDITETTDSYPEFDFLDLLRNLQIKGRKAKVKVSSEESTNKSNLFSEEDSDVEALARLYEEKYGTCNDYAELGEGYDEEDSFIDNSDAVNDLVPSGIQTEFGGFYINRGKLNFVKEDNSSSSTSEDVDKFLAHNRLNARRIISDDENEEKESSKTQSNNHSSSNNNVVANNSNNIISSNSNNNSSNGNTNHNNNHCSNNNNGSLHSNIIKNRKRSGEFQHKSKKIRKTATPKIPEHLLHKKPFPGSLEYRKNIKEFKKNRLKTVETDKKPTITNLIVNSSNNNNNNNTSSENANNNHSTVNSSGSNTGNEDDNDNDKKEISITKKKPQPVKERDGATEVIEAVATGANMAERHQTSSSSESSESSSSDSESDSSEDASVEKEKVVQKPVEEVPHKNAAINGSISKDITAKSFAQLSDSLNELIAKIVEISKDEKNKVFNNKLNPLLLSLDDRLRELPLTERNAVLEQVAEILQMKKDNITKRIKKLLVLQEETKMSTPLRKLKEAVASMMPLLESTYFNEYTKAAGTSPQIYAELSRYYWSIDPSSLPQRKFPWSDELRSYLREIVQYRKNCYYIVRPRKESLIDYIKNFMEAKVKPFWPKEWMTVDILLEEAQVASPRHPEDKAKVLTKMMGVQNSSNVTQKKTSPNVPTQNVSNRKQGVCGPGISTSTSPSTSRKPAQGSTKNSEVKSILIPRKVPQGSSAGATPPKPNFSGSSSVSSHQNTQQGNRLQVTLNRSNVQDYLDRISGSQTSISRSPSQQQQQQQQQISPNRSQQSVSPNRLPKTSSPNSVLNPSVVRQNVSKNSSPNNVNKSLSVRSCGNSQSVLKTIEIHSNPVSVSKSSPNAVTISPVNESLFKDIPPSPEVLNLTKNSSLYISKVKDCTESKSNRSSSPSIAFPLPSGITISPTNASPSTFLAKPQKSTDKINVSITKQESAMSLTKEKRESILNVNLKREGPFQNIPDCISVTSKSIPNERHKYEHVRKRALQEYHQQQHSPERLKPEEKKLKTEDSLLADMEMKDDRLDDKNFSKIFDSVIAKTSETVRQSESVTCPKYSNANLDLVDSGGGGSGGGGGGGSGGGGLSAKSSSMGSSQYKSNNPTKTREVRTPKDKPYYLSKSELNLSDDLDERNETSKEQRVQMEMDRVMQNLVELSREKNPEYEYESQHVGYPSSNPSTFKSSNFQEAYQKMLFK